MRLNLVLAAFSAVLPILFLDNSAIWEFHIFTVGIAIALLAIALRDLFRAVAHLRIIVWSGIAALIFFSALLPLISSIIVRHETGPLTLIHDNPLQIEAALDYLDQGKNPYREDYLNTPLARWNNGRANGTQNMSLYHVVALPGHLLLSFGTRFVSQAAIGFYDERLLYLLAYLAMLFLASRLGSDTTTRQRSLILLALNPLLLPFFREGRNDILVFTFLLGMFLALEHRRTKLSALLLGLALTIKMFAWIFVFPYLAVLFARTPGPLPARLKQRLPELAIITAVVLIAFVPFLLWDRQALVDDLIRYPNGGLATNYPISGLGFSRYLLNAGAVERMDYYPFWIFQIAATLPLLILFLRELWKKPRLSLLIFTGTLGMFTWMYFARFFFNNYFGLMVLLGIAGLGFWERERALNRSA